MAVELAAQLGEYLRNRRRRTGSSRDQAHARGSGAAQIFVWLIEDALGVGQVVDGCDRTMADAEVLMDDLDHRRKAIGGAGGRGNDPVLFRIVQRVINPHDDIECPGFLDRRADHNTLDPLVQIALKHGHSLHLATGFDYQIAAGPVGICNGLVCSDSDALAIDDNAVAVTARFVLPAAVHRVEVQQVGVGGCVAGGIVDLDELQLWPIPGCAQCQTSNPAEAVDTNFDCHG